MRLLFSLALVLSAAGFGIAADAALTGSVTTVDGTPVPQLTVRVRSASSSFVAFHTFAWNGPIFSRPVPVTTGEVVEREGFVFADLCGS